MEMFVDLPYVQVWFLQKEYSISNHLHAERRYRASRSCVPRQAESCRFEQKSNGPILINLGWLFKFKLLLSNIDFVLFFCKCCAHFESEWLLEKKASPLARTKRDQTPLELSRELHHPRCAAVGHNLFIWFSNNYYSRNDLLFFWFHYQVKKHRKCMIFLARNATYVFIFDIFRTGFARRAQTER